MKVLIVGGVAGGAGASPIRPNFPGIEENKVFTLRNIPDTFAIDEHSAQARPRTAAVIGAGFIGLEMAENVLKGLWKPFFPTDVALIPEGAYKLDVRNPQEQVQNGEIPGFVNIPLNQLRGRISEVPLDKPICITCAAGLRGYVASRMLEQHGAREVYNLSGGYIVYSQYIKDLAGMADTGNVDCTPCGMQIRK